MGEGRRTVVGALLRRADPDGDRVLAARRARPATLAGRWEFPGGKVEPGEDVRAALVRELREELAVDVVVGAEVSERGRPWSISSSLELRLFAVTLVVGDPEPGDDHDELRWLRADGLAAAGLDWLEADLRALPAVRSWLQHVTG